MKPTFGVPQILLPYTLVSQILPTVRIKTWPDRKMQLKSLQLLFTEPSTNMVITSIGFIRNHCLTCSPFFYMGWLENTRKWEISKVPSWLRRYQNWESWKVPKCFKIRYSLEWWPEPVLIHTMDSQFCHHFFSLQYWHSVPLADINLEMERWQIHIYTWYIDIFTSAIWTRWSIEYQISFSKTLLGIVRPYGSVSASKKGVFVKTPPREPLHESTSH